MAKSKKMKESAFGKIIREINAVGEEIRTHQDEKQAVVNDFEKQKRRYKQGRVSENAMVSSAKKSNAELKVLDNDIKKNINRIKALTARARDFAARQKPKPIRVKAPKAPGGRKKKAKKKTARRKPARKKSSKRRKKR
jgi:hypothetical protein